MSCLALFGTCCYPGSETLLQTLLAFFRIAACGSLGIVTLMLSCYDHSRLFQELVVFSFSLVLYSKDIAQEFRSLFGDLIRFILVKPCTDFSFFSVLPMWVTPDDFSLSIIPIVAFDTIDHFIPVHCLRTDLRFTDTVLQWFLSFLTDCTHYVSLSNHCSVSTYVHSGVLQGSILDHIPFSMCIMAFSTIIDSHSITHHSFADDLQIQMSAPPDKISCMGDFDALNFIRHLCCYDLICFKLFSRVT